MIFCSLIAAGELVVKEAPVVPVSNITRTCTEISRKQQASNWTLCDAIATWPSWQHACHSSGREQPRLSDKPILAFPELDLVVTACEDAQFCCKSGMEQGQQACEEEHQFAWCHVIVMWYRVNEDKGVERPRQQELTYIQCSICWLRSCALQTKNSGGRPFRPRGVSPMRRNALLDHPTWRQYKKLKVQNNHVNILQVEFQCANATSFFEAQSVAPAIQDHSSTATSEQWKQLCWSLLHPVTQSIPGNSSATWSLFEGCSRLPMRKVRYDRLQSEQSIAATSSMFENALKVNLLFLVWRKASTRKTMSKVWKHLSLPNGGKNSEKEVWEFALPLFETCTIWPLR